MTSDREIVRQLKAFAGYTRAQGRVTKWGDEWEFKPWGVCVVASARVIY